jgi:ABC-type uncharacterized transport system permease subunit
MHAPEVMPVQRRLHARVLRTVAWMLFGIVLTAHATDVVRRRSADKSAVRRAAILSTTHAYLGAAELAAIESCLDLVDDTWYTCASEVVRRADRGDP